MIGKKKWLVILPEEMYVWIKETSKRNRIKGSDVVVEAVERIMEDKNFTASLAETHLKVKLQKLNDEEAELMEQKSQLQQELKSLTREKVRT